MKPMVRVARRAPFATWICSVTLLVATVAMAAGTPTALREDIPAQPLPQALDALARQTGLHIIYVSSVVQRQQSRRAEAGMGAFDALTRLLEGTGLSYTALTATSARITTAPPAAAPPAQAEHGGAVIAATNPREEILVTARHRSEPEWSVPLAVTVVTGDQLEHQGIGDLSALSLAVPGMSYNFLRGGGSLLSLRGLSPPYNSTTESNVATLYDGLYVSNAFVVDMNMLDLHQIEVLRGPQNALVGRNAFAGAILYEPRRPTERFESRAEVEGGSNGFARATAYASGPLSTALAGRVAAALETFDGTIRNRADANDMLGGWRREAVSASLQWDPGARLSARLSGFWYQVQRDATPRFPIGGPAPPAFNCERNGDGDLSNYCGAFPAPESVDISPDARGQGSQTRLGRLELTWHARSVQVTSLTGYVSSTSDSNPDDWDLSSSGLPIPVAKINNPDVVVRFQPANIYYSGSPLSDRDWSEDLRASGSAGSSQWQAGVYAARNDLTNFEEVATDARGLAPDEIFAGSYNATLTPLVLLPWFRSSQHVEYYSVYGSLSAPVTATLDFALQLRWNRERLDYLDGSTPLLRNFSTPRFTLSYRVGQEAQLYASGARGARSALYAGPPEGSSGLDTNWTYELGFKSGAADEAVQGSATVFFVNWDDMQLAGANSARVTGFELAVDSSPSSWLSVHALYAYTDARFRAGTPDVGGHRLPYAPVNAASLRGTLHGTLLDRQRWSLEAGVDLVSSQYAFADNLNWFESRSVWNVRGAVAGDRWEAALWVRNAGTRPYSSFAAYDGVDRWIVVDRANGGYWGATLAYQFR